jgi:hypothetical protein
MKYGGGGKRKKNDRASTILKYITSVKVENITMYLKLLNNEGMEGKG